MDDLLDIQNIERKYKSVSKGKRFANYIIDTTGYYLCAVIFGVLFAGVFGWQGNEDFLLEEETAPGGVLLQYLLGFMIMLSYYSLSEYLLKGKTLGKYITKTRAVTLSNERMDLGTTIKRSLCRLVPFDALSFLRDSENGWHDRWSNTKVIIDENWREY